ncbi:MAG: alpha/beta hydrolase [Pseudomonadota bacterium]
MQDLMSMRRGQGFPLVLVHGYLAGGAIWSDQFDHFEHTFDVIAPDLPGFAGSKDIPAPESIPGFAEAVLDHLDGLGVRRFHLIGHSMGGMVVQHMAKIAGQRIEKLVLYGTGPVGVLPGRFETIDRSRQRLREEGLQETGERIAATWFVNGREAPGFEICRNLAARGTLSAALACLTAWEDWDGTSALKEIDNSTLVLWGDCDRSYGWSQPEALWRGIRNASLAVVPGCGHAVHLEKRSLFNQIVEEFLTETEPKRATVGNAGEPLVAVPG